MKIALIYGGEGYEREVSCLGFSYIFPILEVKYEVFPIFIDTKGVMWLKNKIVFPTYGGFATERGEFIATDCALPLLHGDMGEDGVVQNTLRMAKIPYVGCMGPVGALCRDKWVVKAVARSIGIPTLPARLICRGEEIPSLTPPIFVKPTALGSSVGAMAAKSTDEVKIALENAFSYTDRVLIEPYLEDKRELECGYFSVKGKELFTNAGEILSDGAFYDYDSKYGGETKTCAVADLDDEVNRRIKDFSLRLVRALGVRHLSRIDFFLSGNNIFFNEINTMPGFTAESLYPRMLAECGLPTAEMLDLLIEDCL